MCEHNTLLRIGIVNYLHIQKLRHFNIKTQPKVSLLFDITKEIDNFKVVKHRRFIIVSLHVVNESVFVNIFEI